MHWIPLYDFNPAYLRARCDGRFGYEDPFQWPQLYVPLHPWSACIPAKPGIKGQEMAFWGVTRDDFKAESHCAFGNLGRLNNAAFAKLKALQEGLTDRVRRWEQAGHTGTLVNQYEIAMRLSISRLESIPMTYRDIVLQVAEFQRISLDVIGFLDWRQIYNPRIMNSTNTIPNPVNDRLLGAFTFDPTICQILHLAGVPVWLIRPREAIRPTTNIYNIVQPTPPFSIEVADWNDGKDTVAEPFVNLHYGCSGPDRHISARSFGSAYHDAFSHLRSNNSPPIPDVDVIPKQQLGSSGGRRGAEKITKQKSGTSGGRKGVKKVTKQSFHVPCKPQTILSMHLLMSLCR